MLPPCPPFVGGLGSLKSRVKKRFIQELFNITFRQQTPTDRLRDLDLIRMYTPLQDERRELRIPESI